MISLDEIVFLREKVLSLHLHGSLKMLRYSVQQLQQMYNGIGPEWFPVKLRKLINAFHPTLKPVAMQHDVDYATGAGTWDDFCQANSNFAKNGRIAADATYPWWHLRRYLVRRQASIFADLCQSCGWKAYLAAIETHAKGSCNE